MPRETLPVPARLELQNAFRVLEHPSFAARLGNVLGIPIETGLSLFPLPFERALRAVAEAALKSVLNVAIGTMPVRAAPPRKRLHTGICIATGAVGGFFGLPGLLVEIPLTTAVILRTIASIAKANGESLEALDARLACIEVFALGGRSKEDDAAETGYYEMRIAMAAHFSAFRTLFDWPAGEAALPATVVMIRAIAARFGVVISDKAAAQMVPVLGAAAGALVNATFIRHFQNVASGHFTVRRLERQYGNDVVRAAYEHLRERSAIESRSARPAARTRRRRRATAAHRAISENR